MILYHNESCILSSYIRISIPRQARDKTNVRKAQRKRDGRFTQRSTADQTGAENAHPFFEPFLYTNHHFLRQARDKHRKKTLKKATPFLNRSWLRCSLCYEQYRVERCCVGRACPRWSARQSHTCAQSCSCYALRQATRLS